MVQYWEKDYLVLDIKSKSKSKRSLSLLLISNTFPSTSTSTHMYFQIRHNTLCIFHCGPGFVALFDKNATLPPPDPMHCFPKHTGTQLHFFRHSVPVVILAHVSIGKPGRHCKTKSTCTCSTCSPPVSSRNKCPVYCTPTRPTIQSTHSLLTWQTTIDVTLYSNLVTVYSSVYGGPGTPSTWSTTRNNVRSTRR